jgi:hypothetical protein
MKKIFFYSLLIFNLIQLSCKKDKDPEPVTVDPNSALQQNGSISGTINTSSTNSATENFSYNFPYSSGTIGSVYYGTQKNAIFSFVKYPLTSGNDLASGTLTFGATDSTKNAPTAWSYTLNATNPNTAGTFFFNSGSLISQTNSSISGYSFTNNIMSFTITTNAGFMGGNGKPASVVTNFKNMPIVNAILRVAAK